MPSARQDKWATCPDCGERNNAKWDRCARCSASLRRSASAELATIRSFIIQARAVGILDERTTIDLLDFASPAPHTVAPRPTPSLTKAAPREPVPATAPAPATLPPAPESPPVPSPAPRPTPAPKPAPRPRPAAPPKPPREPSRTAVAAKAWWDAARSDLTVHGFLYLGVVLTFVGILGFLLFAFVDLPDAVQPVVELFVGLTFFGWAWMLRRQDAVTVAAAMELVGGMVIPLIVFASLVDGSPIPPDVTGWGVVIAFPLVSIGLAAFYRRVATRRPDSTLRYLVGPLLWLGAMTVGFAAKTDEPLVSDAIARLVPLQPALASVAIAITVVWCLRHRTAPLARPTMRSAAIGVPFAYALTVALSAGSGADHPIPLLVAGAGTAVSIEGLGRWFDRAETVWLRPVLVAGLVAPLSLVLPWAWVGLIGTVAFIGLLVHQSLRGAPPVPAWAAFAGLVASLGAAALDPWAMTASFLAATLWAHFARHLGHAATRPVAVPAAAVLPVGVVAGLWAATGPTIATVTTAAVLLGLSALTRRGTLTREFWATWVPGAAVLLALVTAAPGPAGASPWVVVVLAATALTVAVAPGPVVARIWASGAITSGAVAFALSLAGIGTEAQIATWAALGLASVTAATARGRAPAGHLASIGFLAGTSALVAGLVTGTPLVALWVWTGAALVAVVGEVAGRDGLPALLGRLFAEETWRRGVRVATDTAFLGSFTAALLTSFAQLGVPRPWLGVLLAILGLGHAAVTRVPILQRPERQVLGLAGPLTALAGTAVAVPDLVPLALGLGAVAALPILLAPDLRRPAHGWMAWLAGCSVVPVVSLELGLTPVSLHRVLVPTAVLLFLGGLVADDVLAGRRRSGEALRISWIRYPVVIGAAALPVAFGLALATPAAGWWALAAAGAYGGAAWSLRAGLLSGPAWMFAVMGGALLSPWSVVDSPWLLVAAATPMVAVAWLLDRPDEARAAWLRWDLPALIGAHVVAAGALALALAADAFGPTALAAGLLSVLVGWWRDGRAWVDVGHVLVLVGAALLGPAWLLGGLLGTLLRGLWGVRRSVDPARQSYQAMAVGAVGLGWLVAVDWAGWPLVTAGSVAAVAFGAGAIVIGMLDRAGQVAADTTRWWMGLFALGVAAAAAQALVIGSTASWPALGLVLLATGFELVGRPRDLQVASVALVALAWAHVVFVAPLPSGVAVGASSLLAGLSGLGIVWLLHREVLSRWDGTRWGALAIVASVGSIVATLLGLASGPEALVVALGATAAAVAADRAGRVLDRPVRFAAVVLAPGAWWSAVVGLGLAEAPALVASGAAAVLLSLAAAGTLRLDPDADLGLARAWYALGTAAAGVVLVLSVGSTPEWGPVMAFSLSLAAAAGAGPLRAPWLREASAVGITVATAFALVTFSVGVGASLATFLGLGSAALASAVVLRLGPWVRPLELVAWTSLALGLLPAAQLDARMTALGTIALGFGAACVARALISRRSGPLLVAPVALGAAILFFVNGQTLLWHTIPIGLVLMLESALVERARRREGWEMDESVSVGLEWAGILVAVAPALVGMFTQSLAQAAWALLIGGIVFLWGVVDRVRRRVVVAAALVAATLVLSLFAGAAASAPTSAVLWIDAVGIGFAVMVVAGIVEAFRSRKGRVMQRMDVLMEDWR